MGDDEVMDVRYCLGGDGCPNGGRQLTSILFSLISADGRASSVNHNFLVCGGDASEMHQTLQLYYKYLSDSVTKLEGANSMLIRISSEA